MKYWIYLENEIPLFGCGNRIVEVVKIGRKWVRLKSSVYSKRIKLSLWKELEKRAKPV